MSQGSKSETTDDARCCGTCWHWVSVSGGCDGDCDKFHVPVSLNYGEKCPEHKFDREVFGDD